MITVKEIDMSAPSYKPNLEERETIITFDETNAPAEIFTFNPALIRKLDKLYEERPDDVTLIRAESINGVQLREYHFPKKWVKVNASRILSDEQREQLAERGRRMQSKLRSVNNSLGTED